MKVALFGILKKPLDALSQPEFHIGMTLGGVMEMVMPMYGRHFWDPHSPFL
jgi:hypothetical protein